MNSLDIEIIDNALPLEFREEVWDYMMQKQWHVWVKKPKKLYGFIPSKDGLDFPEKLDEAHHGIMMARTLFGVTSDDLNQNHPLIFQLWEKINKILGDRYTLTGPPEESAPDLIPRFSNPIACKPGEPVGWRAYTNGSSSERVKRSHGIHRDTVDLNDDTTRTILYVANLEWYPSWMSEIVFYNEDPAGTTGDHQQFQKSPGGMAQKRDFKIGWPDTIVPAVPGRIINYDGRTFHTTKAASDWAPNMRITIAFRVRIKPELLN